MSTKVSTVDLLDDALTDKPDRDRFLFFKKPLNWIIILILIDIFQGCSLKDNVRDATKAYTTAPVLVQTGTDGKFLVAKQTPEGFLNDQNVQEFVANIVPTLNRFDLTLPAEIGKGFKGVRVPGMKDEVPVPVWLAMQAFRSPEDARTWLPTHMQNAPKDLAKGAKSTLQMVKVGKPEGKGGFRYVTVTAIQVTENPDGSPRSAQPWARKFKIYPVQRPRFFLKPSLIEQKYNQVLARGLAIALPIEDAPDVLPDETNP